MGNQQSNSSTRSHRGHSGPFRRATAGRLGLSRTELDLRCKPSGLYESCSWDDKVIRKLIGDGKIAARLRGTDNRCKATDQECPICFLNYSEINVISCCKATICSECYLQIQDPRSMDTPCPFCNQPRMEVKVAKCLDEDDVTKREEEEQKVIEAKIKSRLASFGEGLKTTKNNSNSSSGEDNEDKDKLLDTSFGSNLDRDLRMRSRSLSTDIQDGTGVIAMSPEERRTLEREMSSQSDHPLLRQMNLEAERESQRHVLDHMNRRSDRTRASREQFERLMNWTARNARDRERAAAGFDPEDADNTADGRNDASPGIPSLNDLLMLEAAMYLSMREENSRSRRRSRNRSGRGMLFRGRDHPNQDQEDEGEREHDRFRERERERDRMEAAHLFQTLLRERVMNEGEAVDPFSMPREENYSAVTDRLLSELSEARQMEMAIQLSLQEAQERERAQAEEALNENNEENEAGNEETDEAANEEADETANEETSAEESAAVTTNTYDDVNIGNDVDHGEEEVVFDHESDGGDQVSIQGDNSSP